MDANSVSVEHATLLYILVRDIYILLYRVRDSVWTMALHHTSRAWGNLMDQMLLIIEDLNYFYFKTACTYHDIRLQLN